MEQELASIKKPNETEKISKEEFEYRIKSIAHSKRDIIWWAENFFRIVSLNTGLEIIKLYDKQKLMLLHLVNNDRNIILSSRQTGKTTTYTILCMWLATLFTERKIMICANKLQTAIEIMDRLRLAYEYLPSWIKPGITVYNKSEISFENKSTIRAFATSSSASRGFSCLICIIDEMAFIPKNVIDEFFASVMPVVSSAKNSKVIVVSTPNGTSGLYYDLWQQANSKEAAKNKEGWKPFRIDWFEVPGRTIEWKEKQIASIGAARFSLEFGNEFLANATTKKLVPDDILERFRMKLSEYKSKGIEPKILKIVSEDNSELFEFKTWHEFRQDRTYLASADIAEGVGGDSSVLYVWDVTDLSNIIMCAAFSSNTVSVVQFAYVCSKILAAYGDPPLAAERNGISGGMLDALKITYKYPNIAKENKKNEVGIYSHITVKEKACLWAREMLTTEGFGFTIYDKDLIDEMAIFVKKDTKGSRNVYQALPGADSHDDHVMTFIWMSHMLNNDVVDKYFIVCQDFTTVLGMIYPKLLLPFLPYSAQTLSSIKNDPIYKDFIDFKEDLAKKVGKLKQDEAFSDENDIFKYKLTHFDLYFGGFVEEDDDWNSSNNVISQRQATSFNRRSSPPPMFIL